MSSQNSNNITEQLLDNNASLTDLFCDSNMETDVDNNEPSLFQNSSYYLDSDFIELLDSKTNIFTVISLNCQSLNAKFDQLTAYIQMYNSSNSKICAICLQESWLTADSDLSLLQINGYQLISVGKSSSAHGGVAIYLHDTFSYKISDCCIDSDIFDMQFIEVLVENGHSEAKMLVLGNIYRPPRQTSENINTFIDQLEYLTHKLSNFKNVILTGDFNLNLLQFKENNLVNNFLDSMISNSFIPKIMLPTRISHRKGTLIDNIFVKISDGYSATTSGILVNSISDHFPCFTCLDYLQFNNNNSKSINVMPSFSDGATNIKNDLNKLEIIQTLRNIVGNDPNESYQNLTNVISPLINKHFPIKQKRYNKHKHKKSKWMTKGILRSIAYRDKLYIKMKSTGHDDVQFPVHQINFKTYNNILKKAIRAAKKLYYNNCFHKFKSDIKNTWSTINNIICKTKNVTNLPKYFLINGSRVDDDITIANEFNKFFINIGPHLAQNIQMPSNLSFEQFLQNPVNNNFEFKEISVEDITRAIDSLKPKTSFSLDRISNKLLKFLKNELAIPLKCIINQSILSGIFPDSLKIAKVTPLYKKDANYLMTNYRPISILPSASKVFERVMYNQIYQYFTDNSLFFNSQYGFRQKHSTEFAALELIDRIILEMDQNKYPINIYMDLSKAFDTLDHHILIHKLQHYGFMGKTIDLMNSYLTNRAQYVEYNGVPSNLLNIHCGVPQGSILGPLLFIIYMNDLPDIVENFKMILYADDTTLFASLNNPLNNVNNTSLLNDELCLINKWLKVNRLSINMTKTKAMLFHRLKRQFDYPELYMDGIKIDFVDTFNFLGLIIDKNLNWKSHVKVVSNKISKAIGVMVKLKNYVPKSALIHIYNALIMSHLNYGLIVWNQKSKTLIKLQKKAIRTVCNAKFNAHTSALFKKENLLNFGDMCALVDLKFCFKFMHGLLPIYFNKLSAADERIHSYTTRQFGQMRVPAVRHDYARNSITYRFPVINNNMPANYKEKIFTHSFFGFKFYIKRKLIESYSTVCTIENCYVCQN
jgi:hypothetical protein